MKKLIKIHSTVELITNSSTEIFTLAKEHDAFYVKEILRLKAKEEGDLEWFESNVTVSTIDNGTVEVYSKLNDPDWFNDFVEKYFNVIDIWHG
jgi:hypothetical protein